MNVPFFDLTKQYLSIQSEVDSAVRAVMEGGLFIGGPAVHSFESDFAAVHGAVHCVGVGNGTDAILATLKCAGVKQGDEVIVPAFGWISAPEIVSLIGARPVFADVLPDGTLDPLQAEAAITSRTKAIIPIHLYGQAARVSAIRKLCDVHDLIMIEDCAQGHLTSEFMKPAGTVGHAGTFSFYPTKNLGAYGDAGCVITEDSPLAGKIRLFANHGGLGRHEMEGINSRLDTIQAAILSVKCKYISRWTQQRIANADLYDAHLQGIGDLVLPATRKDTVHTFHQYVIRTGKRDELKIWLAARGVQTIVHYPKAMHNLPAYAHLDLKNDDFPTAARCQDEVLSLPVYPELEENAVGYVADCIKGFFGAK